ncbi:acetyl-CoA C-acetyltransferase [Arthrobacter sp. PAMC25564]|uniref:acetyl-CoA C-acetyltransferase n=1 Tax=Arthrobacter sp. PAMC25564 TaxID=2565366 RepID=UPI0010A23853|nr:acetyl-CoA C-acetyltransferase [Arthrobacter sp. PAMC25564]QCB97958.1 acetyl-CoA C-acetyltransferase [Arthrobacter sp. PAMC25564]
MADAYIVDAVRTPVGKRKGGLSGAHPADIAAHVLSGLVGRTGIDPAAIDDVILGCLDQIGSQAGNIARTASLAAGFPESVPGVTIDRQCGSSQQAVHFAAQAVMSGSQDLVIAGGVQKMTQYPILSSYPAGAAYGPSDPFTGSLGWANRFGDAEVSQFLAADRVAAQWGLTREELDTFALESHRRAAVAADEHRFANEILPFGDMRDDEGIRRNTSLELLAGLNPILEGGLTTAGASSQISDAASALLIASGDALKTHNLKPRARVHHMTVLGADALMLLTAPIPATRRAFERTGLTADDIDLFECNEAFAPVVLAWMKELGVSHEKVNVNGGAIALGHPTGASGGRIMTTLLNEMERTGARYGLQTMCEGGGIANVTILERL